jgi:hypothetical protein
MDKESIFELQKIDCNCNDCIFMIRDFEKMKSFDHLHKGELKASHRINYGNCTKLNKQVTFIPNTCQLNTRECFKHRRETNN